MANQHPAFNISLTSRNTTIQLTNTSYSNTTNATTPSKAPAEQDDIFLRVVACIIVSLICLAIIGASIRSFRERKARKRGDSMDDDDDSLREMEMDDTSRWRQSRGHPLVMFIKSLEEKEERRVRGKFW